MRLIRPLASGDRPVLEQIARDCGAFTPQEIAVCLELIDAVLAGSRDYEIAVCEQVGLVQGFLVYGTNPLAQGVWEVYWIVSDPGAQRSGVGSMLLSWLRDSLASRGRLVLIETSGQPSYEYQRRFYLKNGYREVARIADFYKPGDDLVVYRLDLLPLSEASSRGRVAEAAR